MLAEMAAAGREVERIIELVGWVDVDLAALTWAGDLAERGESELAELVDLVVGCEGAFGLADLAEAGVDVREPLDAAVARAARRMTRNAAKGGGM